MEKKLKEVADYKVREINLYSGNGAQITKLDGYVQVTIPVPADIKVDEGNVLAVYRVNDNGSFTNCNATITNGKLTFRTNHFSTFVIVEQAKTAVVPDTGDNSQTGLYVFVLLAGLAAAVAGVAYKKRKCVK
jgi:LPXTG-motif cell wall-anchored protein